MENTQKTEKKDIVAQLQLEDFVASAKDELDRRQTDLLVDYVKTHDGNVFELRVYR